MQFKKNHKIEEELKNFWGISHLNFIAEYCIDEYNQPWFIKIRKSIDSRPLIFPNGVPVKIKAIFSVSSGCKEGNLYQLHTYVPLKNMTFPYPIWVEKIDPIDYAKSYILDLEKQFLTAEGIAGNTLRGAVSRISIETNKKPETFIYELLQNADDYPAENQAVNIHFEITPNFLIVRHNGAVFTKENVYAICSVDAGDKKNARNKIGFKGMGFKSVFKDSNYVWIKSGQYSFRFDKSQYPDKAWQVIPIWTDLNDLNQEVNDPKLIDAPVTIALKPKAGEMTLSNYERIFTEIFKEERLLLFLRAVTSLEFKGTALSFSVQKDPSKWEVSQLPAIYVPEEVAAILNQDITQGNRIPEKYKDITHTTISFATNRKEGRIAPTVDANIYVYLPTALDFGFPFIINGDFIPDGSREKIYSDIAWNKYLFEQAGYQLLNWLKDLSLKEEGYSFLCLIPDIQYLSEKNNLDNEKSEFLKSFENGFKNGLQNIPFLKDTDGALQLLEELFLDQTGLYELLGNEQFKKFTGIDKNLIKTNKEQDSVIKNLINTYNLGLVFDTQALFNIFGKDDFNTWLTDLNNNLSFLKTALEYKWLSKIWDQPVFLSTQGVLMPLTGLYKDFEGHERYLDGLNIPRLYEEVKNFFESEVAQNNKLQPQWKEYKFNIFLEKSIIADKKRINESLTDKHTNIYFYEFLTQHKDLLNDSEVNQIKFFKVWEESEVPLNQVNNSTYFPNEDLQKMREHGILPEDSFSILSNAYFEGGESLDTKKKIWLRLGVKEFSMETFFKEVIVPKSTSINDHIIQNETNSKAFWSFFKNKYPDLEKKSLSNFSVWVECENKEAVICKKVKDCYLGDLYTRDNYIEAAIKEYAPDDAFFIHNIYLENDAAEGWERFWKRQGAKTDISDLIITDILPNVSNIPPSRHHAIISLLFNNFEVVQEQEEQAPILSQLMLKTTSGEYVKANECWIPDHYTEEKYHAEILPLVQVPNLICTDYEPNNQLAVSWLKFFKLAGSKILSNRETALATKIEYLLTHFQKKEHDLATKCIVVGDLLRHKEEIASIDGLRDKLGTLLVLTTVGEMTMVKDCYFESRYKPKVDIEKIAPEENRIKYISFVYAEKVSSEVFQFFKDIGASEGFKIVKNKSLTRSQTDSEFISYVDANNSYIRTNIAEGWQSQHRIIIPFWLENLFLLQHQTISKIFWTEIIKNNIKVADITEATIYQCKFQSFSIKSYLLFYIQKNSILPTRNGDFIPLQNLVSVKLANYCLPSEIPDIDFTNIKVTEESNLEQWLGIKQELSIEQCLRFLLQEPDIKQLKDSPVLNRLKNCSPNQLSAEVSAYVKKGGKLPGQKGIWCDINNLVVIEDDDDFNIGARKFENVLHKELESLASIFTVKRISKADFTIEQESPQSAWEFKNRVIHRLKYIVLCIFQSNWEANIEKYRTIINDYNFYSVKKISYTFKKVSPTIENSDITFHVLDSNVYFKGRWNDIRGAELIKFIQRTVFEKKIMYDLLVDILLATNDSDIIDLLEEKKFDIPRDWKRPDAAPKDDPTIPEISKVREPSTGYSSDVEIPQLEDVQILGSNADAHDLAQIYLKDNGYTIFPTDNEIAPGIIKASKDGVKKAFIVLSAKAGTLYLGQSNWQRLGWDSVEMLVLTGDQSSDFIHIHSQEELLELQGNDYTIMVKKNTRNPEVITALTEVLTEKEDYARFYFKVKQNSTVFEYIKGFEQQSTEENVVITEQDLLSWL